MMFEKFEELLALRRTVASEIQDSVKGQIDLQFEFEAEDAFENLDLLGDDLVDFFFGANIIINKKVYNQTPMRTIKFKMNEKDAKVRIYRTRKL
jgi:hypothetical protein